MSRYIPIHLLAALLTLLCLSCRKGAVQETPGPEDPTVTFSLVVPGANIPDLSREMELNGAQETHIETIDILQFDGAAFVHHARGSDITTETGSGVRKFSAKVMRGTHDLVVLANAREVLEAIYPSGSGLVTGTTTRNQIEQALTLALPGKWITDPGAGDYRHFPMYGEEKNVMVSALTETYPDVRMHRMTARVDVQLSPAAADRFELQGVYVYYRNAAGQVMPASANWSQTLQQATAPSVPPSSTLIAEPLVYPANTSCLGEIYLFEAAAGNSASDHPFLLLEGKLIQTGEKVYYRADLTDAEGNLLPLLRNYRYNLTVTSLNGSGYLTPGEAASSLPTAGTDLEVLDESFNHVVYDSRYFLAVAPTVYTVGPDDQINNSVDVFTILTNYGSWSYTTEYGPGATGWLYEYEDWKGTQWAPSYEPGVTHTYTGKTALRFTVYPNNSAERELYFRFRAGPLMTTVKLVQEKSTIGGGS